MGLAVLLLTWGAAAVITQSILIRETTVLFFAGEISWGIVLFAWLAGVGIGAWLGGRVARRTRRADRWLAAMVAGFAAAGPVSIMLLRVARAWLDVGPGQYIPMVTTVWLSGLLVGPFGLLIGGAFPLACKAARGSDDSARIGWVYLVESAGSFVGGVAFTFLLAGRVGGVMASSGCGVCLLVASGAWLRAGRRTPSGNDSTDGSTVAGRRWGLAMIGAACALSGAVVGGGRHVEQWSLLQRWRSFAPGLELRASVSSRYQDLALGWRDGQFELYANGHPTATFPEPTALRWPGQMAMCQHPNPRRVLLLGGGVDGLLAEVLTHGCVERVDYVELDPAALRLVAPSLPPRDRDALADPRVRVAHQDARRFVQQTDGPYDLVIGRFGAPASALVARFYTVAFYQRLAEVMGPDGVLAFQTESSPAELRGPSAACMGVIYRSLRQAYADVVVGWGPHPWVLACKRSGVLTTDAARLGRRLSERGVPADHFAAEDFAIADQLDAALVAKRRSELDAIAGAAVSTDLHPRIYLLWLQRWEQQMRERSSRRLERAEGAPRGSQRAVFAWLGRFRPSLVAAVLLGAWALWLGSRAVRRGRHRGLGAGAALASIASTGFVAMAAEIVLLFAYQSLNGYVYEQIGAMIGLFMLGLVVGSAAMNRSLARRPGNRWWLMAIDLSLAVLVAVVPVVLTAIADAKGGWTVTMTVYGLVAVTGALGGAAFPLAARIHATLDGRADRTAGAVDSADHLGACMGALLTGVALVPSIGIWATCAGLAGLKIMSAAGVVLWAGRRPVGSARP